MANNILEMALELLEHEQKFLPSTLSAWFGDATVVSFTDNRLVLHSPSDFKQKYITDKFIEPLQNALYQLTELLRIFLTGTRKNGIIILLSGCSDSKCKVSSSVERSLPKPQRRVRFPYLAPECIEAVGRLCFSDSLIFIFLSLFSLFYGIL